MHKHRKCGQIKYTFMTVVAAKGMIEMIVGGKNKTIFQPWPHM